MARLSGPEPTKTVLSTARVSVLIMATAFCDGIVAYINGSVGLMANAEAGKAYSATRFPKVGVGVGVGVGVDVGSGVGVGVGVGTDEVPTS